MGSIIYILIFANGDNITDSMDTNLSKLQGIVEDRGAWHATISGVTKSQT